MFQKMTLREKVWDVTRGNRILTIQQMESLKFSANLTRLRETAWWSKISATKVSVRARACRSTSKAW